MMVAKMYFTASGHQIEPAIFQTVDVGKDAAKVRIALHLRSVNDFTRFVGFQFGYPAHDAAQAVFPFAEFMLCVHLFFSYWFRG